MTTARLPDDIVAQALAQAANDKSARLYRLQRIARAMSETFNCHIGVDRTPHGPEPTKLYWEYSEHDEPSDSAWIREQLRQNPVEATPAARYRFIYRGALPGFDDDIEIEVVGYFRSGAW